MRQDILIARSPAVETLTGQVRGFATNRDGKALLLAYGLPEKVTYQEGSGAETLYWCVTSFRGRPGWLILPQDLRALGKTKKVLAEQVDALERAGVRIMDLTHPEDKTYAAQLQRASVLISGTRFRDRRTARRRGREGGLAKGSASEQARAAIAPDWLVRNIVADKDIPWEAKIRVFDGKISESTLRRHYRDAGE